MCSTKFTVNHWKTTTWSHHISINANVAVQMNRYLCQETMQQNAFLHTWRRSLYPMHRHALSDFLGLCTPKPVTITNECTCEIQVIIPCDEAIIRPNLGSLISEQYTANEYSTPMVISLLPSLEKTSWTEQSERIIWVQGSDRSLSVFV
jgi:hypothetical protein